VFGLDHNVTVRMEQERRCRVERVDIIISLEGNELEFEVLGKVDSAFSLERL
jgi:hypothetical protein